MAITAYIHAPSGHSSTIAGSRVSGSIVNPTADDLEVTDFTKGVILKSPDGTRWRLTIDNDGTVTRTPL